MPPSPRQVEKSSEGRSAFVSRRSALTLSCPALRGRSSRRAPPARPARSGRGRHAPRPAAHAHRPGVREPALHVRNGRALERRIAGGGVGGGRSRWRMEVNSSALHLHLAPPPILELEVGGRGGEWRFNDSALHLHLNPPPIPFSFPINAPRPNKRNKFLQKRTRPLAKSSQF